MSNFPEKISDREKYIYDQVVLGNFEATWTPLDYTISGKQVKLNVMSDALKIEGVRVNVSANLQQRLADLFDASLLTAQVADLMYVNASYRIDPSPVPISSSVSEMIAHSKRVDSMIGTYTGGIVAPPGKHWILDKKLDAFPNMACNYGWHFLGTVYRGIKGFAAASFVKQLGGNIVSVIQPNACAHDPHHMDYSQVCQLVSQTCWVDGEEKVFSDLLKDQADSGLVTFGGPLKNARQPGVPESKGLRVLFPTVVSNYTS